MIHLISLKAVIKESESLVSLPDILLRLRRLINDPHSSADDMAKLISSDPSISAKVLKIVNSPLYYLPRTVSSISQAITLIGSKQLYALVTATSAAAIIQSAGRHIDMQSLWKHSVYSACGAKILAEKIGENADTFFISGLLCNVGTLAVVNYAPDIAGAAIGIHRKNQFPWDREKEVLGFTMAEAGGALLDAWNLPYDVITPVLFQHTPDQATEYLNGCHAMHAATRIASEILQFDSPERLDYLSSIGNSSLAAVGCRKENLAALVEEVANRSPEMFDIFTI